MAAAEGEAKRAMERSKSSKRWSALKGIAHANAVVKTIPHGIDSETFLGDSIPAEVRAAVPALHDVADHRAVISQVVSDVQRPLETLRQPSTAATHSDPLAASVFSAAYTGVLVMLQAAIRHRTKLSVIQADLAKMNAPEAFVADFVNVLRKMRATLEESAAELGTRFPGLTDLRWRVDVTISTSEAKKVMQPSILMQMALTNGEQHTFDMPVAEFHKLRYNVAKILHEMGDIRSHPVMQLAFDSDKAAFESSHS